MALLRPSSSIDPVLILQTDPPAPDESDDPDDHHRDQAILVFAAVFRVHYFLSFSFASWNEPAEVHHDSKDDGEAVDDESSSLHHEEDPAYEVEVQFYSKPPT